MEDFEEEMNGFNEQVASLNLFGRDFSEDAVNGNSEKYLCYRAFVRDAIGLLEDQFPVEAAEWYAFVVMAAAGDASQVELRAMYDDVRAYRKDKLGITRMTQDRVSRQDALTMLFLYGLAQFPALEVQRHDINIAMDVDRFAMSFLESFGRARELIGLLKDNFKIG